MSWNINGLRRKIDDTDFLNTVTQCDILFLSETWLHNNSFINSDIDGFICDHLYGNKSANTSRGRYSGGISVYFKHHLKNKITVIEKNQAGIIWIKCCKSLFNIGIDVYIGHIYIPPKNSSLNTNNIDFFETLECNIERYKNLGKVFITGDLNSRCSNVCDVLDFDMYIDDEELSNRVYIPPRASKDHVIDTNGKRLIELCQSTSFIIGNGRLHDDLNVGEFTFHSHRGSSLVDYLLLEPKDIFLVSNFKILQPNELSDHSGILFSLASRHAADEEGSKSEASYDYKIKWDDLKNRPV